MAGCEVLDQERILHERMTMTNAELYQMLSLNGLFNLQSYGSSGLLSNVKR